MYVMYFLALTIIVKARERTGTKSLDLTLPVSLIRQYNIKPGDVFVVRNELNSKGRLEITYRKLETD